MNNFSLKQIFGAVTVMFFVLFMLIIAGNWQDVDMATTNLTKELDTTLVKPLNPAGERTNPPEPAQVMFGAFNTGMAGSATYADKNEPARKYHYKMIRSDKLKDRSVKPILKLEVINGQARTWIKTEWSWIDYDQGIMYFHFMTEDSGEKKLNADYTGNYQVLL